MEWKNILRGIAMGTSDLIPGVSGGTIAVILGIYDRLIEAISGVFSRQWKKHIGFLIPLAIGMGTAILGLSRLIEFLLLEYYAPTQFFFIGLILGIIPLLMFEFKSRATMRPVHIVAMVIGAILVASMAIIKPADTAIITELSTGTALLLFFSGWLGSMAMLLPGISGSFVLLLIGVYPTVISALSNLNVLIIGIVGLGVAVGFIVSSKVIRYLLGNFPGMTFSVILGLVIGSLAVVFPGLPETATMWVLSVVSFVAGFLIVRLLGRFSV
ncbi:MULTISPECIES: DUF368 domain-containing protein [Exiguobacterium]|uniref:DUF368 domain-containing protein n=1 Tax=Exiguobacterium TaxID=33986 RepID=UPI0008777638|nr:MULTISPECIES: DUF368 domain-containing protein [Exiguobacterium]TCI44665.1 DUF368 domain-containing protein [Exiguobacterium sp. SH5S32]TCI51072.1 DUF368 domain-containing protein [Exiguobacterium sp. SH1S4]TCI59814.1 DUF368 domain-containing protein [Exiguobacterium sp. SH0S2]TCI61100.1 DUF368 domain-containing protein [Exiguobacterium sp. SH3S1]TCI70046.1 DUF368 domain-containing protein [Exiguobacterium sp. SH1S1]